MENSAKGSVMTAEERLDARVIIGGELATSDINETFLIGLREKHKDRVITDFADTAQFDVVHSARMEVKGARVTIQKVSKKTRERAVKFQKDCIAEEKRLLDIIEPTETHLMDQENRVLEEKARIKAEAEAKIAAAIQARMDILYSLGFRYDGKQFTRNDIIVTQTQVAFLVNSEFDVIVSLAKEHIAEELRREEAERKSREDEAARLEKVAKEQEEERKRLDAEKKRQDEEAAKLRAQVKALEDEKQKMIDAEKKRLQDIEDEKKKKEEDERRAAELEQAKKDAAAQAIRDAEEKAKKEAAEKAAKEEAARIRTEKKEARRPDKEKLQEFIAKTLGSPVYPAMKTADGRDALDSISMIILKANDDCVDLIEKL
jgi:myosin heavy subunit